MQYDNEVIHSLTLVNLIYVVRIKSTYDITKHMNYKLMAKLNYVALDILVENQNVIVRNLYHLLNCYLIRF